MKYLAKSALIMNKLINYHKILEGNTGLKA